MKKYLLPFLLLAILLLAACSNEKSNEAEAKSTEGKAETITYESENGPVEVPADPQRVIVLSTYAGDVMALDVPLVGVDAWSKNNPRFDKDLANVEEVTEDNLEKIIELEPDLIVGLSTIKNIDKLKEIAPTVTFTYGKVDYLTQHLEIGKLLNKEKEAQDWITDFQKRAQQAGDDIRAEIGEDATVSVIENFDKQLYVFGDNWGRGTEILYQEMKLKMPEKVKEMALKDGYYALSQEVLPEYMGDYVIFSKDSEQDNSFQETDLYKNTPAVKNGQVFEANAKEFYFNDPLTLEYQLEFFIEKFLGKQ
ncbi:iron-hydroxamate ABC transporter substrate-binding protein [Planomicrobium chinense]|uniref:iron-hydroxamate ABC transporter substrate-binding protein n=1 Tax=Planococcus TaxID=1372 RepID=UPI001C73DEA7|nr:MULTISPECIES: iron-hydroxamate ABC transporter substrate-binding protein [Planococcus]MBX0316328.1 iron-hydroxamate ABC transporter substrate-binding protein [Planococcus glaciei]MBZ5199709.1 iron-hydroxamate ABC transporter substrate-binding protein [Planococcus chinensis]